MTVEDWEAADSTALWINLKLGVLPVRESLVAGRKGASEENRQVVPLENKRNRLAGIGRWLIGIRRRPRHSAHRMESARRHLRLTPHLRLVWSRRDKMGVGDSGEAHTARSLKE